MKIPIKQETIRAIYSMYRSISPFCRWNLPKAEDVFFTSMRSKKKWGEYDNTWEPGKKLGSVKHRIKIDHHADMPTLLRVVAHEMVHLRQQQAGYSTKYKNEKDWHQRDFKKMARQVCKRYGFKLGKF